MLAETKVWNSLAKGNATMAGTNGGPASVGHTHAFGNIEEKLRLIILGCPAKGDPRHGHLNHSNGRGYVAAKAGHYQDALFTKKSTVLPLIHDSFGGICPHAMSILHRFSRQAGKTGGRDGTAYYYISKAAPKTFMAHHIQRISLAVNVKNAAGIARSLNGYFKKLAFGDNLGEAARM